MYPFASLPDNLAAFAAALRLRHGFRVGPRELQDAVRALAFVALGNEREVRDALRPILSGSLEEVRVFDRAFTDFFHPGPAGVPQTEQPPLARSASVRADVRTAARRPAPDSERGPSEPVTTDEAGALDDADTGNRDEPEGSTRSAYSPLDSDGGSDPAVARADDVWRAAAAAFVRRVQLGLSRRWRPARRGRRFDVRRTLRASLQTGGEMLAPRWLRRPRRSPRFVMLVDGSRSMEGSVGPALRMAVAIATVTRRVEVFTFSTSLERVTPDVRRASAGRITRLPSLRRAWGGGTAIGACLREFLRTAGDRAVTRDTVVIIASDGLDVGDPRTLAEAMRELRRKSAGVIWINPLLATAGYEPTAAGMRAALPSITTFTIVTDAASLAGLGRKSYGW